MRENFVTQRAGSALAGPAPVFAGGLQASKTDLSGEGSVLSVRIISVLSVAVVLMALRSAAAPGDHGSNQIESATFTAHCDTFKITVTGRGVDKPNPLVGYNIKLTPKSGTALIITDSFSVIPTSDGSFSKTFTNSWKTFGFTLDGKYSLSGSAVLVSGLTPLSTVTIAFAPAKLNCRKE